MLVTDDEADMESTQVVKLAMNKPIRTISIFCMLLFLALMINATYLQYWQAGALDDNPLNRRIIQESFSRERGAILVDGKTGRGQQPERRRVQVPAGLPAAVQVRAGDRLVLLLLPDAAWSRARTRCCPATTPGCS